MCLGLANIVQGSVLPATSCEWNMEGLVTWRSGLGKDGEMEREKKSEAKIGDFYNQGPEQEPSG